MTDERPLGRSHFEIAMNSYTLSFRRVEYFTFDFEKISNGTHYHDCYEMVYVISGEAIFRTDKEEERLGPSSLYMADPGALHEIHIDKRKQMSLIYFVFSIRKNDRSPVFLSQKEKTVESFLSGHKKSTTGAGELKAYTSFFTDYISLGGDRNSPWFGEVAELFVFNSLETLCHELPGQSHKNRSDESRLEKALDIIDKNMAYRITAEDLANQVNTSRRHLYRLFRTYLNKPVHAYITERKIRLAESYLRMNYSVSETAGLLGMESLPLFSRSFKKYAGMTPMQYKKLCSDGTSGFGSGIRI